MNLRICFTIAALALTPAASLADASLVDDSAVVSAASLQVKERLKSIEQINVTAPTQAKQAEPVSKAVADLLQEAETLDAESDSVREE